MSVQNTLKKPSFSRAIRGYSTDEVDRYIAYVNERYSAVCYESAQLKKQLTELSQRLASESSQPKQDVATAIAAALSDLAEKISVECARHAEETEKLISERLTDATGNFAHVENTDGAVDALTSDGDDLCVKSDGKTEYPEECAPKEELEDAFSDQSEVSLDSEMSDFAPCEADCSSDTVQSVDAVEEDNVAPDAEGGMTPAQRAALLDFYPDGEDHNGESFDPMTLAASSVGIGRRSTRKN